MAAMYVNAHSPYGNVVNAYGFSNSSSSSSQPPFSQPYDNSFPSSGSSSMYLPQQPSAGGAQTYNGGNSSNGNHFQFNGSSNGGRPFSW